MKGVAEAKDATGGINDFFIFILFYFILFFRFHGMNRTLLCIFPSSLTAWVQIVVVIQFLSPVGIHLIPTSGPTTLNASHTLAS